MATKGEDEKALDILLQLGKLVYEQRIHSSENGSGINIDPDMVKKILSSSLGMSAMSSNQNKKVASSTKREGVRRYPRDTMLPRRPKRDYVSMNIQKYSRGYSRRKTPPIKHKLVKSLANTQTIEFAAKGNCDINDKASKDAVGKMTKRVHTSSPIEPTEAPIQVPPRTRGDVVMHFPFCDDTGSVGALLAGDRAASKKKSLDISPGGNFNELPRPLQRRMIEKVFDEFRVSKCSMRVTDINEGLQV